MKVFRRPKPAPPERRRVTPASRTNQYAYYSQRSAEPAALGRQVFREALYARTAKRAARYWAQRFGLLVAIAAIIVATVSIMSLSTDPKVMPLDASSGLFLHSMSAYEQAARQLFDESILNHNKLTVDTNGISAQLKRQFPELSVVNITLPLVGHRAIIYVAGAQPALLLQTNDGRSFVVDETGRAIATSGAAMTSSLHLLNIRDNSGTDVRIGQPAVASKTVAFIETVQYQMEQKGLGVSAYDLPAGTDELDMYLDGRHYFVKFNLASGTALQQAGTFLAVKHNLEEQGIAPASYIDVRVDGRAYYK